MELFGYVSRGVKKQAPGSENVRSHELLVKSWPLTYPKEEFDVILQIGSIGGGDGEEGGGSGLGGGGLGDGGDGCAGGGLGVGGVDGGVGDVVCDLSCTCALQCYLQPAYVFIVMASRTHEAR